MSLIAQTRFDNCWPIGQPGNYGNPIRMNTIGERAVDAD